ncbi:CgeB family protein [Pontibacter sp. CAU 1760]
MNIVILGLAISSSQAGGHTTIYRNLLNELHKQGHQVLFLEREVPAYEVKGKLSESVFCETGAYKSLKDLERFTEQVRDADMVILGSRVSEGIKVAEWVLQTGQGIRAFYDLDTPLTLAKLAQKNCDYLSQELIPQFDLYLSITGGPNLEVLEKKYGAQKARPFYRTVDAALFYPEFREKIWDLGYLGRFSEDSQPQLNKLMLDAAQQWPDGRFVVAGTQYLTIVEWPSNTKYSQQLQEPDHRKFFNSLRFALQLTPPEMETAAYAPSPQLLEAAACGTPIISNHWDGLDDVFKINSEILVSTSSQDTLSFLREISKSERKLIGERARKKVLSHHIAACRVKQLMTYAEELMTLDGEHGELTYETA